MTTESQNEQILRHLETGARLTPITALIKFGCLRLSGRIYELRKKGVPVQSERVEVNGKVVASYFLPRTSPFRFDV